MRRLSRLTASAGVYNLNCANPSVSIGHKQPLSRYPQLVITVISPVSIFNSPELVTVLSR